MATIDMPPTSTLADTHLWRSWFYSIFNYTKSPYNLLQYPSAPPYAKGAMYFDTTLNKLRIGGATGWETVQSS